MMSKTLFLSVFLLFSCPVLAFSQDDKTMGSSDAVQRFTDPDDMKAPGAMRLQGAQENISGVDPSAVRYEYDPASHSYVPTPQK